MKDKSRLGGEEWAKALEGIRRGMVLRVKLDGQGAELDGTHYAVVVSDNDRNKVDYTVIVVPLTSHSGGAAVKSYEVPIPLGEADLPAPTSGISVALPHQVRTIAKTQRVTQIYGSLSEETMNSLEDQLASSLGFGDLED